MRSVVTAIFLLLFLPALSAQPVMLRGDMSVRKVMTVDSDCSRLARDPSNGKFYYTRGNGGVVEVDITTGLKTPKYDSSHHKMIFIASGNGGGGLAIAGDGTMYLCGYPRNNPAGLNAAMIVRGKIVGGIRVWDTLAYTDTYVSAISRDHLFNAIELSPDGKYLFVNSGSRTDHGDTGKYVIKGREYPITSAIFRLPINGKNIHLWNNSDSLKQYLFADGTRNTYDMAFAPDGELFGVDNADVADDHEELNWIREGYHYGFPWRLSIYDNPQQYPWYDPNTFRLLTSINKETINYNDPTFPPKPAGIVFTDPVLNIGPDADRYRDTADGLIKDASLIGTKTGTFSPHGSPLAVTFDRDSALTKEMAGDMFVMTYNDKTAKKFAPFNDPGEDLMHVKLKKVQGEERFEATVTRIAQNFQYPVDAVLYKGKMYVVENGTGSSLWEVTLPAKIASVNSSLQYPNQLRLEQNYPNPFNPSTVIQFSVPEKGHTSLTVFNAIGQQVALLYYQEAESGEMYQVRFNAATLASGLYFSRLEQQGNVQLKKMMLIR